MSSIIYFRLNEKNMTSEYISNELCSDGIHSITSVSLNSTLNEERIPDLPVVGDVPENTLKHAQNVSVLQIHQLSQEESKFSLLKICLNLKDRC